MYAISLSIPWWAVFEVATRLVVGGFMIATGVGIASSPWTWRQVWFATHQLVPAPFVRPVAMLLPVVEMVAGILLLLGAFGTIGVTAAAIVLGSTTAALGVGRGRRRVLAGGSLGRLQPLLSHYVLLRNSLFVVAIGIVAERGVSTQTVAGLDPWMQMITVAAVIAGAGTAIAVYRYALQQRLLTSAVST